MTNTTDLKVAKSSRTIIDSIENAKEEFRVLISKIDNEVQELSQKVRNSSGPADNDTVGRINKLKMNFKQLQDLLTKMETMDETAWETLRPEVAQAYEKASTARQ